MSEQQNKWFDELYVIRNNTATTLMNDFAVGNIWKSVVEKYSDQAHFIYELLQNADDARATKSSFELSADGLYFRHNGTKHFWVSTPATEKEDQSKNLLGDINAITAVAQSNKKDLSTIGKFGVGFKAVFQYTESPHIFDPNFCFKIDRYIVPVKLENDLNGRTNNETVFYFPFDKEGMPPDKAYSDILGKLKNLIYPTLFLTNLKEVSWKTGNESGTYRKETKKKTEFEAFNYELISHLQKIGSSTSNEKLILFTRYIENQPHPYSVGYFLDESGQKLIPKAIPAFCFFPTKEVTNLNFIIHAPFLLTDSREGIKKGQTDGWNENLIIKLAQLAADSLLILRDLKLIDDDIVKVVPYKETDFYIKSPYYPYYTTPKFYAPFFERIKNKLQAEDLLPSIAGEYVNSENAYWASAPNLPQLFTNEQLASLYDNVNAKWIFRSLGYNNVQGTDKELGSYISDLSENSQVAPTTILGKLNSEFTLDQESEWLHKLYEYLSENKSYQDAVKTRPIFIDSNRDATPAFKYDNSSRKHELILFLPEEKSMASEQKMTFYKTVHPELLENEKSREFIENFGIRRPSLKDEIYNHILPLYEKDGEIETDTHFKKFFKYWKDEGRPEDFINLIKDKEFVSYKTSQDDTTYSGRANTIYYPSLSLKEYFHPKPNARFVDLEDYHEFIEEKDRQALKDFLLKLGASELPRIIEQNNTTYYKQEITFFLDGCQSYIEQIDTFLKSRNFWNILKVISFEKLKKLESCSSGSRPDGRYNFITRQFDSPDLLKIRQSKWLLSQSGDFVAPNEIVFKELMDGYDKSNKDLIDFMGFKSDKTEDEVKREITNKYSTDQLMEMEKLWLQKNAPNTVPSEQQNIADFDDGIKWLEKVKKEHTPKPKPESASQNNPGGTETENQPELNFDEDEELAKGIDALKKHLEVKSQRTELIAKINSLKRYSYEWFETYLHLLQTYAEKQSTIQQKTVSFQEIKPYKADNKYFLLRGASTYVSPEIEDATDIKLKLAFKNREKVPVVVEGVSKKGQDLLVYCPTPLPQQLILLFPEIVSIEINFTPIVDLFERLYKAFINRNYLDE